MTKEEAIQKWKELGITHATFTFDCGGDSMNETSTEFHIKTPNKTIDCTDLDEFFDHDIYKNVEFYVNSDGPYIGEFGEVEINLEDEDSEEAYFSYTKNSQSEWTERYTEKFEMNLSEDEINLIKKYISNINGGWGDATINYKGDFILSDEDELAIKTLAEKMKDFSYDCQFEAEAGAEEEDSCSFTTNRGESNEAIANEIEFVDGGIMVEVTRNFIIFKDEN